MDDEKQSSFDDYNLSDSNKLLYEFLETAQNEMIEAQKRLEDAKNSVAIFEKVLEYNQKEWSFHLLQLIEDKKNYFDKIKEDNPGISEIVEKTYEDSKKETNNILRRFPSYFEKACSKNNLDIDSTSRHPRYKVCQSFLEVEVLEKSKKARISDREGTLETIPCDIDAVIKLLKTHNERLFGREFDPNFFLNLLYTKYKTLIKNEKMIEGDFLPIRKITTNLGKNIKGFRTDEFLVDISKLLKKGELEIDGNRLDFQHTKNSKQGMLLHGLESRGYIGFIAFKKVTKDDKPDDN
ncbi:MAG: hypothetical protein PWQ50_24 [Methanolobus sp.]|jgi:hypothetical protein|nr:hypothetical protein [Methanolobus sp.]